VPQRTTRDCYRRLNVNDNITIPTKLFVAMRIALATADEIFETCRLNGTDQNPKGVRDLVGSASIQANRVAVK
jgi:hypothetical protein